MTGYVKSICSDPLQENYLALYIAIVFPYTVTSEEVFLLMRRSLDKQAVATDILRNAFKVLRCENLEDAKMKTALGADWQKAKLLAELAAQYDTYQRQGFLGQGQKCHARLEVRPERGKGLYGRE
ncbi:MAG: hypothetical protein HFI90_09965 [Clostridia bacterium]|nr:hypothetical protein [Clostridia bacterium]